MMKNAKNCPAALGTEELVGYLHTLLQENSHNMRNLWVNDSNEATLPVRFQAETKRWKIAKEAQTAGQQIIKEYNALTKAQQVPQKDVLEKAMQMKMNKIKILSRKQTKGHTLDIATRKRDDGVRIPDNTPMKTRRVLQYTDDYVASKLMQARERKAMAVQLRMEYDAGITKLTQDEIKEAKLTLEYEDELRASVGQGTTEDDLNNSLLRIYNYMARQMCLTHMTGLLQPDHADYTSAKTVSAWGDKDGNLESTKDRLTQAMQKMIGLNPKIENLHVYVLKTTRALEVLRWFCSIYKKEKKVKSAVRDSQAQIALQMEQVFLANQNMTPMLANTNPDVQSGAMTRYEFYVNALDSMERSRSELASQGKDKTVRFMKKRSRGEDPGEESGEGGTQESGGEEEETQPVRKLSLKGKQGSKLAAELQTTTKSQTTKQVFVPSVNESDEDSISSDSEKLTKPRSSAKRQRKGASNKSSKAPKSDSLVDDDDVVDPPSKKSSTPKKKSAVNKIKKKKQESEEDEEVDDDQLLQDAIRKIMAEQKGGTPMSPSDGCRLFARGACTYGARCKFKHDAAGVQNPSAGADAQRSPRPRGRSQGQQHHQQRNPQPGLYHGVPLQLGFMPPPGAAPPAGVPPVMLQLPPPAGPPQLQLPFYPPAGLPPAARPQGQVNLLNPNGPPIRPGSLCDNLMRVGKCNYRICRGSHGGWTPGAQVCRFETERKPCPHQANGSCNFMHNVARGN